MKQMNPFQKLKFTIDRIGLEYIPSNDQQSITGQTVYKYTKNLQQEQDHVPYFKTQGVNQQYFKRHSSEFRLEEIEQIKNVYQNQQRNLVNEINSLNIKISQFQNKYQAKCKQNQRLTTQIDSIVKQNHQLRAYILDLQQKSARKMSQSGVLDRQRKLKEQIDRINVTVMDLAKQLNTQKTNKKSIQKQFEQFKLQFQQKQQNLNRQKTQLKQQIMNLHHQIQKRTELLQHSIKSSRDQKISSKTQLSSISQKYEAKIYLLENQIKNDKQQMYNLKNQITDLKHSNRSLQKENDNQVKYCQSILQQLKSLKSQVKQSSESEKALTQKNQQMKLQLTYYQQQLQEERSNTKVKVVEVRDESLQMELSMYKKQCKDLLKQKSILQSVRKDKSQYTIISQNQIILNKQNN